MPTLSLSPNGIRAEEVVIVVPQWPKMLSRTPVITLALMLASAKFSFKLLHYGFFISAGAFSSAEVTFCMIL